MASATPIPQSKLAAVVAKLREVKELLPRLTDNGKIIYPVLDELKLEVDQEELLAYMVEADYLTKSVGETVLTCPKCHKANAIPVVKCPKCGSLSITKERLLEHKAGGHIHPEAAYRQKGGLVCPTCGKPVTSEADYRVLATWFQCAGCGAKEAQVLPELKCLEDGNLYSSATAELKPLYHYKITDKATVTTEFDKESLLNLIVSILPKGANATKKVAIQGRSGASHSFDISIKSNKGEKLIDVAVSKNMVDDMIVLASYAKVFDVGNQNYMLVAWPGLSPTAKNLSQFYKIQTVEASSADELRSRIEPVITV
ncbi:MAG: hypothetical protein HYU39_02065 [Thaumarchaeota archaeon]|nr:hypothetical protein [Nitrososphaerota archaeon]